MGLKDIFRRTSRSSSGSAEPDSPPRASAGQQKGGSPPSARASTRASHSLDQSRTPSSQPARPASAMVDDRSPPYLPQPRFQDSNFSSQFRQFGVGEAGNTSSGATSYENDGVNSGSEDMLRRIRNGRANGECSKARLWQTSQEKRLDLVRLTFHEREDHARTTTQPSAGESTEGRRSIDHSYAPKSRLQALLPRPPLQEVPVYEDLPPQNYGGHLDAMDKTTTSNLPPPVPPHGIFSNVQPPVPPHETLDNTTKPSIARKPVGDGQAVPGGLSTMYPISTPDADADATELAGSGYMRDAANVTPSAGDRTVIGAAVPYHPEQEATAGQYSGKQAPGQPSLHGILDLSNTEDTVISERYAPAVVHEKLHRHEIEVVQESITREIHNHHYIHRVLPIIDVEVLPPRHFIPVAMPSGATGFVEASADQLPARVRSRYSAKNWVVVDTSSASQARAAPGPRQFTARKWEGKEGDSKAWVDEQGVERSETWWVHPPELSQFARAAGETMPMHFGHPGHREPVLGAVAPFPELVLEGAAGERVAAAEGRVKERVGLFEGRR